MGLCLWGEKKSRFILSSVLIFVFLKLVLHLKNSKKKSSVYCVVLTCDPSRFMRLHLERAMCSVCQETNKQKNNCSLWNCAIWLYKANGLTIKASPGPFELLIAIFLEGDDSALWIWSPLRCWGEMCGRSLKWEPQGPKSSQGTYIAEVDRRGVDGDIPPTPLSSVGYRSGAKTLQSEHLPYFFNPSPPVLSVLRVKELTPPLKGLSVLLLLSSI